MGAVLVEKGGIPKAHCKLCCCNQSVQSSTGCCEIAIAFRLTDLLCFLTQKHRRSNHPLTDIFGINMRHYMYAVA